MLLLIIFKKKPVDKFIHRFSHDLFAISLYFLFLISIIHKFSTGYPIYLWMMWITYAKLCMPTMYLQLLIHDERALGHFVDKNVVCLRDDPQLVDDYAHKWLPHHAVLNVE